METTETLAGAQPVAAWPTPVQQAPQTPQAPAAEADQVLIPPPPKGSPLWLQWLYAWNWRLIFLHVRVHLSVFVGEVHLLYQLAPNFKKDVPPEWVPYLTVAYVAVMGFGSFVNPPQRKPQ